MPTEFDTKILELLRSLPTSTLRRFARKNNVKTADDATNDEIIEELRKHCPGAVRDKIRAAFLIDVESIGEELNENLTRVVEAQVKQGIKSLDTAKWVIGISGTLLALLVTLTGYKILTVDEELKRRSAELSELQKKANGLVTQEQAFINANSSLIIRRILSPVDELLRNFSLTISNLKTVQQLKEFQATLSELEAARLPPLTQSGALTKQEEYMDFLKGVVTALIEYESLKSLPVGQEKLKRIATLSATWIHLKIPADSVWDSQYFTTRFESYRSNVLGMLAYQRAEIADVEQGAMLTEAESKFNEAITSSKAIGFFFTRPSSNLALVISKRIELMPADSNAAEFYRLFKAAHSYLDTAIRDESSDQNLVLLYNNKASTYQDEAAFDRKRKDLTKARESFKHARTALESARKLKDIHPVVYTTLAEIEAEEVSLDYDEEKQVDFKAKSKEIIDFIKKAIRLGYTGYLGLNSEDFFKKVKALDALRAHDKELDGSFVREIEKLLGEQDEILRRD